MAFDISLIYISYLVKPFSEAVDDYEKQFELKWKEYSQKSTSSWKIFLSYMDNYGAFLCLIIIGVCILIYIKFQLCNRRGEYE